MDSAEKIRKSLLEGFQPFLNIIKREITTEDLEALLKIPIRRISLYDINKAKKERAQIKARIEEARMRLGDVIGYAEAFLDSIIEQRGADFPRKTTLSSFSKVEVRSAATRNRSLYHDEKSGYIGTALSSGRNLFEVSEFDKVLIIKKDGSYSVHPVSERQFFGRGLHKILLADKETLPQVIHTIIYRNEKRQLYIKRCRMRSLSSQKTTACLPQETASWPTQPTQGAK